MNPELIHTKSSLKICTCCASYFTVAYPTSGKRQTPDNRTQRPHARLHQVENRQSLFHILNPITNIFYETPSNLGFDPFADEKFRVLILVDVLKLKAI